MSRREALLLALVVAAALAAAFSFHVSAHPGELHDPDHEARFLEAKRALPLLGAVRVRSDREDAAHRLRISKRGGIQHVVEPARALKEFRYGRLLYGTPEEVRTIRDALRRKELPRALPKMPEVARVFADRWGPYSCDVILSGPRGLDTIRAVLPNARLSGEPVRRAREREDVRDVPRGLIVALVLVYAWCRFLRQHAERRLLAATLALAALGALGWGVDGRTVLAVAVAAGAPRGPILGCGALLLLFPQLALKRMGLVFLIAAAVRWRPPRQRLPGSRRAPALVLLAFAAAVAIVFASVPVVIHKNRWDPAATLVGSEGLAAKAKELRGAGLTDLVGADDPVPPAAERKTRVMLNEIFRRASDLARTDSRFAEVRDAAAVDSLYWPADLRARLRTTDGRVALWTQDQVLHRPEFSSSQLYRLRGRIGLSRASKIAAVLLLLLVGAVQIAHRGALLAVVVRAAAVGAAIVLSIGAPEAPLLAMASAAPSGAVILAAGGFMATMPGSDSIAAVMVALVSAASWAVSLRRPPRPAPPAQTNPVLPAPREGS